MIKIERNKRDDEKAIKRGEDMTIKNIQEVNPLLITMVGLVVFVIGETYMQPTLSTVGIMATIVGLIALLLGK